MIVLKILAILLGLAFILFGYFIYFRKKYNLINGFEADFKAGRKNEDYQLKCAIDLYDQMRSWYADFLQTENGKDCIAEFDRTLPGYVWMSDVKKIDFYLWSIRD